MVEEEEEEQETKQSHKRYVVSGAQCPISDCYVGDVWLIAVVIVAAALEGPIT